jgi:hypothetical protein
MQQTGDEIGLKELIAVLFAKTKKRFSVNGSPLFCFALLSSNFLHGFICCVITKSLRTHLKSSPFCALVFCLNLKVISLWNNWNGQTLYGPVILSMFSIILNNFVHSLRCSFNNIYYISLKRTWNWRLWLKQWPRAHYVGFKCILSALYQ